MRNVSRRFVGLLATSFVLLVLASPGLAQGRYRGRHYTKGDVDRIIKRVEDRSDSFVKLFDKGLDKSILDGTEREDRLNERAKDLEKALDKLRDHFDRSDTWQETRSRVEDVLAEAGAINRVVNNRHLKPNVENSWSLVRADLNRLAGIYNLPLLRR